MQGNKIRDNYNDGIQISEYKFKMNALLCVNLK